MSNPIPIIDLFAGPGGLGEGFSSIKDNDGNTVFQILLSIEKDEQAHRTLLLRSYLRKILTSDGRAPAEYCAYVKNPNRNTIDSLKSLNPEAWNSAVNEALCAELIEGDDTLVNLARQKLSEINADKWVLIGGPPCQAYSLVGRSRRTHDCTLDSDIKQTLYKCYLRFITELKPAVFVMENVKGILSAQHQGHGVFEYIKRDMEEAGYTIHSLVTNKPQTPSDYVVKSEEYGIPQARHRVILLGIKADSNIVPTVLLKKEPVTLNDALKGIPKLRSGFSLRNKELDNSQWAQYLASAIDRMLETPEGNDIAQTLEKARISKFPSKQKADSIIESEKSVYDVWYRGKLGDNRLLPNHESRNHLCTDLDRYLFCACFAKANGRTAKLSDFPDYLIPNHKNAKGVKQGEEVCFSDRFRVQLADRCSTTITSHICKDGHYYIHPDPNQCRSLTVREAARLQTFPDDYYFEGNRTSQYQQVGNAVPPLLAQQIAAIVASCLTARDGN